MTLLRDLQEKHPELKADFAEFEMTREEIFPYYWKRIKKMHEVGYEQFIAPMLEEVPKIFQYGACEQGVLPTHLHNNMFLYGT